MLSQWKVDYEYFGEWLDRVQRGLDRFTPQELARELVRMAFVADASEAHREADTLRFARKTREG